MVFHARLPGNGIPCQTRLFGNGVPYQPVWWWCYTSGRFVTTLHISPPGHGVPWRQTDWSMSGRLLVAFHVRPHSLSTVSLHVNSGRPRPHRPSAVQRGPRPHIRPLSSVGSFAAAIQEPVGTRPPPTLASSPLWPEVVCVANQQLFGILTPPPFILHARWTYCMLPADMKLQTIISDVDIIIPVRNTALIINIRLQGIQFKRSSSVIWQPSVSWQVILHWSFIYIVSSLCMRRPGLQLQP